MLTATLLTLVVLPVLYTFVEKRKEARLGMRKFKPALTSIVVLVAIIGISASANKAKAQEVNPDTLQTISLEEAQNRAIEKFPGIKVKKLQIEGEEALQKTAWDFGNTQIFTGREEAGNGSDGVYTRIGVQQQNIDIFGIAPRLRLQKERIALAENSLDLSIREIKREVKLAWGKAYTARKTYGVYQELDSLFTGVERAAKIRLEVEETSKLAYLATSNQANEVVIQKEQAYRDYLGALQKLNLWLVSDTLFTVRDLPPNELTTMISFEKDAVSAHPLLDLSQQRIEVAEAELKEARSEFLPQLQGQFGWQEIAGQTGFHSYQVGLRIPLIFAPELGRSQQARIQREVAAQNYHRQKLELNAHYLSMCEEFLKWQNSWRYYRDKALPLAQEQRSGSVTAYREGAIDYVAFLQSIRDAIRIEIKAWEALGQTLDSRYKLQYYLQEN
jgi:cobalt-zinc-cadmium resistance protein CzcA